MGVGCHGSLRSVGSCTKAFARVMNSYAISIGYVGWSGYMTSFVCQRRKHETNY